MAVTDIIKWPSGILKILHVVFVALTILLIALYATDPLFDGARKSDHPQAVKEYNEFIFPIEIKIWTATTAIALIFSIVLLVLLIFKDPAESKLWLLIYYIAIAVLLFIGLICGCTHLDNVVKRIKSVSFSGAPSPYEIKYVQKLLVGLICNVAAVGVYAGSAIINLLKGWP